MTRPEIYPVGVRAPLPGVVYPPQDMLQAYAEAGVLTHETLADGLRAAFARHADRPALCLPQRVMSYRELDEATDRLAAALLELGVRPTERVLFHLGNSLEMVLGWIACLKAAIIPVCTLAAHRELELGYLGRHSAAVMHFIAGDDTRFDSLGFARRLRAQVPSLRSSRTPVSIRARRSSLRGSSIFTRKSRYNTPFSSGTWYTPVAQRG